MSTEDHPKPYCDMTAAERGQRAYDKRIKAESELEMLRRLPLTSPADDRPNNYRCPVCGEDGHETDTCKGRNHE